MVEMASEMGTQGTTYPQIGFCFEEITEVFDEEFHIMCYMCNFIKQGGDFSIFIEYTENYSDAVMELEKFMNDRNITAYFKVLYLSFYHLL